MSAAHCAEQQPEGGMPDNDSSLSSSFSDSEQSNDNGFTDALLTPSKHRRTDFISQKVAAVLDRTNTSICTSTMIMASLVNEVGGSTSSAVLSKSTVHRQQQRMRSEAAEQIKDEFHASKSVVHWGDMLLPDMTGVDTKKVDRLPVMISSLADGNIKLLGVPKLISGAGKVTADAVLTLLKSWKCDFVLNCCL